MGGINMMNLGAIGAMLPSPAAGIPKQNLLTQLGQEATQIPLEAQKLQQTKNQTELQKTQIDDIKRKTTQERYDRNLQLVKNNPALKNSSALISAIDADAKALGIVAPITQGSSVAGSSTTANPTGSAAANPAGGDAPAGNAAPAQEGGMGAPLNMPAAPAAGDASAGAPPAGAQRIGGGPGGSALAPNPAGDGREIDMDAIAPAPRYNDWALVRGNLQEAFSLTPDQRRAAYGQLLKDAPPEFWSAKKTWGIDDTQHEMTARSQAQSLMRSNDPKSVTAAIQFLSNEFKDDPTKDISALLPPDTFSNINKLQRDRLDIQRRAGIISEKTLDLRTKQADAQMELTHSRVGLNQYMMEQRRIQNEFLPARLEMQLKKSASLMETSAQNAQTRAAELAERIKNNTLVNVGREKADALRLRAQLQTNINSLRGQMNALTTNGGDQSPTTDEQGQPSTIGAEMAKKILAAEKARDDINTAANAVSDPKNLLPKFPSATAIRPSGIPAGATEASYQHKPAFYDAASNRIFDAQTGKVLYP